MISIKKHTHQERTEFIEQLLPQFKAHFGDNLIAVGGDGSYARGEDSDYSDLELIVFLKALPPGQGDFSVSKIIDGQLIVIVAETRESYITKYLDVSDVWYASGAGKLLPLLNTEYIEEINTYKPKDIDKKCRDMAAKKWLPFQEISAKLLNEINKGNNDALPLIFADMFKQTLVLLAYVNQTPYKTLGSYVSQAKTFNRLPEGFAELLTVYQAKSWGDLQTLTTITTCLVEGMEALLTSINIPIFDSAGDQFFGKVLP